MLFVRRGCAKFRKRLVLATNGRLSVEGGGTIGFSGFLSAWLLKNGCLWLIICVATLMCSFCFCSAWFFKFQLIFFSYSLSFSSVNAKNVLFTLAGFFREWVWFWARCWWCVWCCWRMVLWRHELRHGHSTTLVWGTPGFARNAPKNLHQDWWFSYFGPSLKVSSWNLFKPENSFVLKPS